MAQRRMFSKTITESDLFLDMPLTTQALYFHLGMQADDDGFVSPNRIMRMIGSQADDLKVLFTKHFIIPFENGVVVIRHWKENNYIQNDRKKDTIYLNELNRLDIDNNVYNLYPECIQNVHVGKDRIGKDRIGKDRIGKDKESALFKKPSLEEIKEYCIERNNSIDSDIFYDFYESKGWFVGKSKMKDWKAAVRNWERREFEKKKDNLPPSIRYKEQYENDDI